jgi:endonuclease I
LAFLKKWNEQDPVDDAEMERNNAIEKLQGNRNPFIDYPELANDITRF